MNSKTELDDMVVGLVEDEAVTAPQDESARVYQESDPEWSEYVLDQMHDSELKEGNPTVDGLRRVTEKIYGEILGSNSEIVNHNAQEGNCTIKHTLEIHKYANGSVITVSGCIDVKSQNIPHPYNQHIVATADTRAEGKALRRALKLRVITAEEMQNTAEDDALAADESITDQQILAINQMCKRLDINLAKAVKGMCPNAKSVRDSSNLQGRNLLSSLSEYQRNSSSVPKKLMGYDSEWRETFDSGGK